MTIQKTAKMLAERTRNRSNAAIYLGGHHVLGATIFGDPIIIDSRDFSSLKLFYLPPPGDIAILSFLYHYIQPEMRCADIGAGCGYYSLVLAALVGNKGSVYGFEKDAERFALLKRNVLANEYTWVHCNKVVNDIAVPKLDFLHISAEEALPEIFTSMQSIVQASPGICLICHINPLLMNESPAEFDLFYHTLNSLGFEGYLFPSLKALESKEQLLQNGTVKSVLLSRGSLSTTSMESEG